MGCCVSRPESQPERISSGMTAELVSSSVSPPQYNEQPGYVVEVGKSVDRFETEDLNNGQNEKKQGKNDFDKDNDENINNNSSSSSGSNNKGDTNCNQGPNSENNSDKRSTDTEKAPVMHSNDNNTCTIDSSSSAAVWPIVIRLSLTGKDISVDLPQQAPYWTLQQLQQALEPKIHQLLSSSSSSSSGPIRIRFIHLGKILPHHTKLIPSSLSSSTSAASHYTATTNCLTLEKYGVIQAMVTKTQ
ncbi:uncharacterized protein BX664DRAFT_325582 [Halteromyces radiatus]|uniref:uncharacterized protein n=1 Tax=Halteromyces radiatus TaxID=101107 RepID=UPI00222124BE|nr:uncharacterized protein BX664DRAFT_325582 [Halteromyces radiatus]KAI8097108.1 hypothetical protein BX664DRAFT_325582 [Halteromyces radiatus]